MVTYFLYTIIFFFVSPLFFLSFLAAAAIKNEGICSGKICVPKGGVGERRQEVETDFTRRSFSMMMMMLLLLLLLLLLVFKV